MEMKTKTYLIVALTSVLIFGLMQSVSLADKKYRDGDRQHKERSIAEKFFKAVKLMYVYQDKLKLTDEQLDQIKDLKVALKKDLIRKKAEVKVIKIEIHSLMYEKEIDLAAINKLIDQKYEIKKAKSKMVVDSCVKLKKILTEEQLKKFKETILDLKKEKYED
jgi:Spy/CpxP family protein refolding chaperone